MLREESTWSWKQFLASSKIAEYQYFKPPISGMIQIHISFLIAIRPWASLGTSFGTAGFASLNCLKGILAITDLCGYPFFRLLNLRRKICQKRQYRKWKQHSG